MRSQICQKLAAALCLTCPAAYIHAQQVLADAATTVAGRAPMAASAPTSVPGLIPYSGTALDSKGTPLAGESSATFLIYKDQQGGEPLFTESQMVSFDPVGHYKVQLGASNPTGIPAELFSTGEARWLEVQVAGQEEQPRILLASVPYALKAADAATLGGLPASAFVLAGSNTVGSGIITTNSSSSPITNATSNVTTNGGTTNKLAKFSTSTNLASSTIYDDGTNVGIHTTVPSATLTVNGTTTLEGQLLMPAQGTATASGGFNSQALKFNASSYNSSSKTAVVPRFAWQAEFAGNNTASPNATLNLVASPGTPALAETGLYFNTDGTINFATRQTFPAISSSGTAVDGRSGSGTGVQGTSGSATGVAGTSNSGDGMLGYTIGGTLNTAGVLGGAGGPSGFGGIAGVWGDAGAHVGVLGTSTQYSGVQGLSTAGPGVQGTSTNGPGVQGSSTNSWAGRFSNSSSSSTVYATNTTSSGGAALYGVASGTNGIGLYTAATASNGTGVEAFADGNAVNGISNGDVLNTAGVLGVAGSRTGASGIAGVWGDAQEHVGVIGSSKDYSGVYGVSTNSYGVQALSTYGAGVYGVGGPTVTPYFLGSTPIGVWGDSQGSTSETAAGIVGTGLTGNGGVFFNKSDTKATIFAYNYLGGGTTDDVIFRTFEASTPDGSCGFGGKGDMTCTGQVKSLATTGNGSRTVETYSMQSPENWMEDFGSGKLKGGVTTVSLEAAFADTVSDSADYHVFLTPRGDSKGLYVTNTTPTSFEVHESGGGTSAIAFDYRIVAKRRGFETQRMADVTEAINTVKASNALRAQRMKLAAQ